jgi:chromosome segregation ATPase
MSLFDLIPSPYRFATQIAGIVVLGIALMAGYYHFIAYHEDIGYQRAVAKYALEKAKADQIAIDQHLAQIKQKEIAENEAAKRKIELEETIASLHAELDRMRVESTRLRSRIATLTVDSARRVADAAITVFSECTAEYSKVAGAADECLSERQTLIDAWPK